MKRLIALLLCVFGLLAAPLRADVELSFDFYYDQLAPLGEWVEVEGYGYVWHPTGVDEDWAPYIDGYWTYTDAGWTWVSYEDWGAICYHYGRWVFLDDYGWCWVPGYEWGPAWVSWRSSDDYIGWAPLPPECDWEPDRGISIWVDTHYDIGPRWYSFCRVRDFGAPVLRHVLFPRHRNFEICFSTVNITNITYNRGYGCVYNGGFDYDYIRARCDRDVPVLKLVQNTTNIFINNNGGNVLINSPRGNALVVAAPRVAANAKNFTRKPAVRRTFKRDAITRGWAGSEKPEMRDRLVSKMRAETRGLSPANRKAQPVKQEALAVVPKEVDLKARPAGLKRLPTERSSRATASREEPENRSAGSAREGRIEKLRPNGRDATAEVPQDADAAKGKGNAPVAGTDNGAGGLRKRPAREGNGDTPQVPGAPGRPDAVTQTPAESPGRKIVKPERATKGEEQQESAKERAARAAATREAQENAQRRAQENAEEARENAARVNAARQGTERQRSEQAEAARAAAERVQRQREAAENAGRGAEMRRQAQEEAGRENAARENAARQQAAEAAARRAQMDAERARQSRGNEQAEAAQRQAAQRAAEARREAIERQGENARRQAMERQNDSARQQAQQRQAEALRERAAAQQNEMRQRAAENARERAMDAQRQQAAEANRARAMENQQRAAAAAQAQAQAQAQARAQAQAQQRGAEAAARRSSESRSKQSDERDPRKRR